MSYVTAVAEQEVARSTHPFGHPNAMAVARKEIARSTHPFGAVTSASLGAISASQWNAADEAVRKKIPASLRDVFKVTPFIPNSFKQQFLAKPVSTLVSKFNVTGPLRNTVVSAINKAAVKQGLLGKKVTIGQARITMRARVSAPAVELAVLWIYLMQRNPVASIQGLLEAQWGAVGAVVSNVANAIVTLVGLKQPGIKGLGAATPEEASQQVAGKPPASSNEPSTAQTIASTVGSTATIMSSMASIAAVMGPTILPILSALTGGAVKAGPPASTTTAAEQAQKEAELQRAMEEERRSGAQAADQGGLPWWIWPLGIGGGLGLFVLAKKKR